VKLEKGDWKIASVVFEFFFGLRHWIIKFTFLILRKISESELQIGTK